MEIDLNKYNAKFFVEGSQCNKKGIYEITLNNRGECKSFYIGISRVNFESRWIRHIGSILFQPDRWGVSKLLEDSSTSFNFAMLSETKEGLEDDERNAIRDKKPLTQYIEGKDSDRLLPRKTIENNIADWLKNNSGEEML